MLHRNGTRDSRPADTPDVNAPTFEALVATYRDPIFGFLRRLSGSPEDAEDLCQETFLRAYRAFGRLGPDAHHRAWLHRIAYNAYLNHCRSRRPTHELPPEVPAPRPTAEDTVELVRDIAAFVAQLPPKQRAALVLRHVDGLAYQEVAQALNCSEESARANVFQAVKKLRDRFGEEYRTRHE